MRRALLSLLFVSVSSSTALAQFQQLVEFRVKPGQQMVFENYLKKLKEAADKTGSPVAWSTFAVPVGRDGVTYRVGLVFQKWAERDRWDAPRSTLVQAFGEQEGTKVFAEGSSAIESSVSRIWEVLPDGSTDVPGAGAQLAPFYDVTIRYVKPERVDEYRELQRQATKAFLASDETPRITRWILRYGTGSGTTFRRTQPFETWADREGWDPNKIIAEQMGEDAPLLYERLGEFVWKTERFVSAYRADLSRTAPAASN